MFISIKKPSWVMSTGANCTQNNSVPIFGQQTASFPIRPTNVHSLIVNDAKHHQ